MKLKKVNFLSKFWLLGAKKSIVLVFLGQIGQYFGLKIN